MLHFDAELVNANANGWPRGPHGVAPTICETSSAANRDQSPAPLAAVEKHMPKHMPKPIINSTPFYSHFSPLNENLSCS